MRVVSLLPSATEIVHALGEGASLVGRSEECDYPPSVRDLPVVMKARAWDGEQPSAEIDARVQRVRSGGASLYELDLAHLRSLAPELLLTQDLCGVCSVTDAEVEAACRRAGIAPRILTLGPTDLDGVWASIEAIGGALGRSDRARQLSRELRARAKPNRGAVTGPRPRVAVVEWLDPPILAGLWTPQIVETAGGSAIGVDVGGPGVRSSWAGIEAAAPDLVVIAPCSFSVARTRRELETSRVRASVDRLHPPSGTWLADEAYFSRPGPRLACGVELVRDLLEGRAPAAPMPVEPWGR